MARRLMHSTLTFAILCVTCLHFLQTTEQINNFNEFARNERNLRGTLVHIDDGLNFLDDLTWSYDYMKLNENESHQNELLSTDGYLELCSFMSKSPKKCVKLKGTAKLFQKIRLNWTYFSVIFTNFVRKTALDTGFSMVINSKLLIYFFLIKSGIEQNPGPAGDDQPERKRFRKSGLQYKTYLTDRFSFENAPKYLQNVQSETDNQFVTPITTNSLDDPAQSTMRHNTPEIPSTLNILSVNDDISYNSDSESSLSACSVSDFESDDFSDSETEDVFESTKDVEDEKTDSLPIYHGAQITLGESALLMMTFAMNYNLTSDAFSDLIDLVQLHCKESNLLPSSCYELRKWFQSLKITPRKHYYCEKCLVSVEANSDICPNSKCNKTFSSKSDRIFFVEVPLIEQLKKLFAEEDFRKLLVEPSKRVKSNITNYDDVFDGEYYKNINSKQNLSSNDLTFTWNTDGVPLFKSSKTSMWPLFLSINELPYKLRRNPENLLLVGLWIGPKKPEMLTFLKPFIDDLQELEKGIEIQIEVKNVTIRGFLISGTADLPAKCTVHNMVQFNGKHSCPQCTQPGKTASSGKGISHIFPFIFDGPTDPKRTHEETLELAEIAANSGKRQMGIKGPCWFTQLKSYDFVKSNCIDYMHCVLLGVSKQLINLWFSKEHSGKPYSFFEKVDEINNNLSKLKPPLYIRRAPRSLSDLKYWKASEFKSFLLFYGPVILIDVISYSYYSHFLLLSEAIYILLKESITVEEVDYAENLIEHFVATFSGLYEERFLTLNIHLLLHLPYNVRQLGPIWGYSCFPFENANGFLMKLVRGTQSVHSQLLDSISIMHGLPYLKKMCVQPESRVDYLMNRMNRNVSKTMKKLKENIFALGKVTESSIENISADCYIAIANFFNQPPNGNIYMFKRLKINGNVFHSKEYTRVKVRNSFTIRYIDNKHETCHGIIHYFTAYKQNENDRTSILAIITKLTKKDEAEQNFPYDQIMEDYQMKHFVVFDISDSRTQKIAIDVEQIECMCVYMVSNKTKRVFICSPPNSVEAD